MSNRLLFVLFLFALSLPLFAQSEIGLTLNTSEFEDTTIVDPDETLNISFEESAGFGVSFNDDWTPSFSTEFAAQGFGGDMRIKSEGITFGAGELTAAAVTGMGQWHFNRAGRFSPYVGGGIAFVGGEFDVATIVDFEEDSFDLETETTWVAAAGVDVKLTNHFLVTGDVRYMPWTARPEDSSDFEDELDIDPMIVSAGVKFRW